MTEKRTNEEEERSYGTQDYWESRYKKLKTLEEAENGAEQRESVDDFAQEWLLDYESIADLLPNHVLEGGDEKMCVVDMGCGMSSFLPELRESGFKGKLVGIDYSKTAIDMMKDEFKSSNIDYQVNDVRNLSSIVEKESCAAILDKATFDGMLEGGEEGEKSVAKTCIEVGKAVQPEGVFLWTTMFGPQQMGGLHICDNLILPSLIEGSGNSKWLVDVHCQPYEDDDHTHEDDHEHPHVEGVEHDHSHDDDHSHELSIPPSPSVFVFVKLPEKFEEGMSSEEMVAAVEKNVHEYDPEGEEETSEGEEEN